MESTRRTASRARVPKRTLSSVITSQVRQRIVDGTYAPGTQMNETELAARFATSRGPVREGLQRLVQEGLLVSEPHRGVFVPRLTPDDLDDLYLARSAIERAAMLRLIDRGLSADSLASLEQALGEMALALERQDWTAVAGADLRFHEIVVAAAGSPRLVRMHSSLAGETRLGLNLLVATYRGRGDYLEEHQRIFGHLVAGDREGLVAELETHMRTALTTLQRDDAPEALRSGHGDPGDLPRQPRTGR